MRVFANTRFDGMISLIWILAWSAIFYAGINYWHVQVDRFMFPFILFLALWWGSGLVLAISALRRGSRMNVICGIISILSFVGFLRWTIFPIH